MLLSARAAALCLAVGLFGLGPIGPAAAQEVEAYELQAAFLYHFTKFVTWPSDSFGDPDDPFRICVVGGHERLRDFLEELTEDEAVEGRRIQVRRHARVRDTEGCQIVYVPASHDPGYLPEVLGERHATVLTVGEGERFLAAGGVLQLYPEGDKIRLRVNERARERSRLRMSSRLLQLCDRVRPRTGGGAALAAAED